MMAEYNRLEHWSEDDLRRTLGLKGRQLKASLIEAEKLSQDIDDMLKEQWRRKNENTIKSPD